MVFIEQCVETAHEERTVAIVFKDDLLSESTINDVIQRRTALSSRDSWHIAPIVRSVGLFVMPTRHAVHSMRFE